MKSPVVGVIGPCWMAHPRRPGCVYWVGPHVLGPETHDIGQGFWMDRGVKRYYPPPKGARVCESPYQPARLFREVTVGDVQVLPTGAQVSESWDGKPWPWTSWVDWYNQGASSTEQERFDRITKVLDAGGSEYMQGGAQQDYIERWRFTDPNVYKALVLYRDSGGRRALFAKETGDYGDKPIAVVKPDGPIVKNASSEVILHPGRYTYSAVQSQGQAFKTWLDRAVAARSAQVLRTQASEEASWLASLYGMHSAVLYIDYEFLVASDLVWDPSIPGLPSWLPKGTDVTAYWGKPTPHATPSIEELKKLAEGAGDVLKGLASLAAFGALGYLFFLFANMPKGSRTARTA